MQKTQSKFSLFRAQLILWALWVSFNAAAALLAVVVTRIILALGAPGEVYGFLLFIMCVIFLGLAQGLVLQRRSIGPIKWTLINFSSWAFTYLATVLLNAMLPDLLLSSISSGDSLVIFGALSGLLQWLFLRPVFSRLADLAAQARIVHVIGTTGFAEADETRIKAAARHATIIKSGNMSLGVNLLAGLVEIAAKALGPAFDVEILEMHHRMKADAPSGTALLLGQAAARGREAKLGDIKLKPHDGLTGPRPPGPIGFASLRGGSVVGDHTVYFAGDGERIELTHRADDRAIFAKGALKAALWGQGKGPGLFDMQDVLGLRRHSP